MARNKKPKSKKGKAKKYSTTTTATNTTSSCTSSSPSQNAPISQNIPEPLQDIEFDSLPLPDLLDIDEEECPAIKERKEAALARRHHLIIADDPEELKDAQMDTEHGELLTLGEDESEPNFSGLDCHAFYICRFLQLPAATLDWLKERLPNLTMFTLLRKRGSPPDLEKVAQLLSHYHHQLEEVTILFQGVIGFEQNRSEVQRPFQQAFTSLMDSLNSMRKLRNLKVDFQAAPGCPVVIADDQLLRHSLPDVVCHLETLKFCTRLVYTGSNARTFYAADARLLQQILSGMRAARGVDNSAAASQTAATITEHPENLELYLLSTPLTLTTLISFGPGPVAASLRSVRIDDLFGVDSTEEYTKLVQFACQSPNVQVLRVAVKCLSIWRLVKSLVFLEDLLSLKIWLSPGSLLLEEVVDVHQLPVLPSVQSLEVNETAQYGNLRELLHLEKLFPNVQVVLPLLDTPRNQMVIRREYISIPTLLTQRNDLNSYTNMTFFPFFS